MGLTLHVPENLWMPVATRRRAADDGKWHAVEGAKWTLDRATRERDAGKLLMALQYSDGIVTVVAKRPAP